MKPTENPNIYVFHNGGYDPAENFEEALEVAKKLLATGSFAHIMTRKQWLDSMEHHEDTMNAAYIALREFGEHCKLVGSVKDLDLKEQLENIERTKFNRVIQQMRKL